MFVGEFELEDEERLLGKLHSVVRLVDYIEEDVYQSWRYTWEAQAAERSRNTRGQLR